MSRVTPTQRTLAALRKSGSLAAVVEKWNPHARVRQDLFGIGDVLSICGNVTTLIQCTSGSNVAARITKIREEPSTWTLLAAGWRIEVHGWRKVGPRGKRKLWECRVEEVGR